MDEEKTIQMTPDELKEFTADAVEAGVDAAMKALPAIEDDSSITEVEVTIDEADKPFETEGKFYQAVASAGRGHGFDARLKSLKVEDDNGFYVKKFKASPTGLGEEVPADGGYLVGTDEDQTLVQRMYQDGEFLNRVNAVEISSNANGITLNALDETSRADGSRWGGVRGYWLAEGGTFTASKPTFREMTLRLKKLGALVYATDELLADASALQSEINSLVPAELRFKAEDAIVNGDGSGKPKGILNDSAIYTSVAAETGQASATIVYENLVKMWAAAWAGSRKNLVWFINQECGPQLDTLALAVGTGGLPPNYIGYSPAGVMQIKGRPVVETEYNAALGTLGDIVLADMSQYKFARKGGIQSASSIHVEFLTDQMVYRFIYRCDGQPIWDSSLTPYKGSTALSPFVVLATRS